MIRDATAQDAEAICLIYNHYICETVATFEEQALEADDIATRIRNVQQSDYPWLVAADRNQIIGYAYGARWKERAAYRHTAEVTIYISHQARCQGWGTQLYQRLFIILQQKGFHALIAGITLPNSPSINIHEKFGMEKVAHFKGVGYKFNQWLDVGYWQLNFAQSSSNEAIQQTKS